MSMPTPRQGCFAAPVPEVKKGDASSSPMSNMERKQNNNDGVSVSAGRQFDKTASVSITSSSPVSNADREKLCKDGGASQPVGSS